MNFPGPLARSLTKKPSKREPQGLTRTPKPWRFPSSPNEPSYSTPLDTEKDRKSRKLEAEDEEEGEETEVYT